MEAGLATLREHGYAAFTQPRVAARAGLRQSHITYYHPTRLDLLAAVGRAAVDRQLAAVDATLGALSSREEAAQAIANLVTRHENTRVLMALAQAGDEEPRLREHFRELADGNVGVFDGGRLLALVYGAGPNRIGIIEPRTGGGGRIRDGEALALAVGDLTIRPDGTLALEPLPQAESVCDGRGSVPNIRHLPIDKARAAPIAAGWAPVRGAPPSTDSRERDLVQKGVIEVDSCSGTGMAYCSFKYSGAAGTLSVTTAGEAGMPEVDDYGVECR